MTETPTSIELWLTSAISGSFVTQVASQRGIELEQLPRDALNTEVTSLLSELDDLGLSAEQTAQHALASLACLFIQSDNANAIIDAFTGVLWSILGDPKRNGDKPPELYRKAGFAMHIALLGFFDPSIPERVFHQ